jgi:hypothetical protein
MQIVMQPQVTKATERLLVLAIFSAVMIFPSHGQNFTIDWFSINDGSTVAQNSNFQLIGNIGQTGLGHVASEVLVVSSGFWSIGSVSPLVPRLFISLGGGQIRISWESTGRNFQLEEASGVFPPSIWRAVPGALQNGVTLVPDSSMRLYRLRRL